MRWVARRIVFHALRLVCVIFIGVITSCHLFFFSPLKLLKSALPVSMVLLSKGPPAYCFLYSSYRVFDSSDKSGV